MLQKNKIQEDKKNTPLSITVNSSEKTDFSDEIEFAMEEEMEAIDKALTATKIKPKMVRRNIEHYLEERALKRRVHDVFEDELLLLD
ncbi:MAG TPA: hypothetical protein ENJ33_05090 [Thiothrix sp.]|nr:hypothetical protein [Thiothrix sp.]